MKIPTSPSVRRRFPRRLFPESRLPAVLWPESFRGGCSFGGARGGSPDALSCRVPAPFGAGILLPRIMRQGKRGGGDARNANAEPRTLRDFNFFAVQHEYGEDSAVLFACAQTVKRDPRH